MLCSFGAALLVVSGAGFSVQDSLFEGNYDDVHGSFGAAIAFNGCGITSNGTVTASNGSVQSSAFVSNQVDGWGKNLTACFNALPLFTRTSSGMRF